MDQNLVRTIQRIYFRLSYLLGFAQWDINRPQPGLVKRLERGRFQGTTVLDIGCGPGDNAIFLAREGYEVLGVDLCAGAIEKARAKASAANSRARFEQRDVLGLGEEVGKYDLVVDSGLYHVLRGEDTERYVAVVGKLVDAGGHLVLFAFSEFWGRDLKSMARKFGPRPISREEIEKNFSRDWVVEEVEHIDYPTTQGPTPGVMAVLTRRS